LNPLSGRIKLDFRASEPLYLQITSQIQQMVAHGVLKQGDQLPTVRELATELRINFNTIARAYRLLDEARLISTQRGRGTYIWEEPTEETMKRYQQIGLEELARSYLSQAAQMGFTAQEAAAILNEVIRSGQAESDTAADRPQIEEL
jgi:GntR family transcriptional regulator